MRVILSFLILMFLLKSSLLKGQERLNIVEIENKIKQYMKSNHKNYLSVYFSEFFVQSYPKEVKKRLKTKNDIKYSAIHSYKIGSKEYKNVYFHLDKNYKVVGSLSETEMEVILSEILSESGKMDSLINSIPIPD